jgi:hypothetical protein
MNDRRRWWHRLLELFVMEVHRPDGTSYLVSINPTGFGECWLPVEFASLDEDDIPVAV